jgi:hypothetical protein
MGKGLRIPAESAEVDKNTGVSYADFFDRLEPERLTRYYVKGLEHLGHSVKLEPCVSA